MDFKYISILIEQYRLLNGLSSYPFIFKEKKFKKICWFNYFAGQNGNNLEVVITSIFIFDETNKCVVEHKINKELIIKSINYNKIEISELEYLLKLKKLYEDKVFYNKDIINLLAKTEENILIPAYKTIQKILSKNKKTIYSCI